MAPINWSSDLYLIEQETFSRPVSFISTAGYNGPGRGIYNSDLETVTLEDGSTIDDQHTILDILAADYPILPAQNDMVTIPAEPISGLEALGNFQIVTVWHNGGGEVSLRLRRIQIS